MRKMLEKMLMCQYTTDLFFYWSHMKFLLHGLIWTEQFGTNISWFIIMFSIKIKYHISGCPWFLGQLHIIRWSFSISKLSARYHWIRLWKWWIKRTISRFPDIILKYPRKYQPLHFTTHEKNHDFPFPTLPKNGRAQSHRRRPCRGAAEEHGNLAESSRNEGKTMP